MFAKFGFDITEKGPLRLVKIYLDSKQVKKVLTGSFIEMNDNHVETVKDKMVFAKHENDIVALGLIKESNFHPKKLLIT